MHKKETPRSSQTQEFDPQIDRLRSLLNGNTGELVKYAEEKAKLLLSGRREEQLSTAQIRNVLDELQRMRKFDRDKLQLLRPKLAYAAGRHGGRVKNLQAILDAAITLTEKQQQFDNLKHLVEAIVAYHRLYGGK
jgi:CRISPR-associated protein Csm2